MLCLVGVTIKSMIFDFHVGHDQPESKGGTLDVDNLKPICVVVIYQ